MNLQKKTYTKPEVTVYGDIETLTQQGGASSTDVPQGTSVGPNGIGDVAS
ncbi:MULTISPECIES: hypothetical protein [Chlorogloeopsis]|nr:hypothetical protein [Chlorogloeopsis fritschii]MBF2004241.1 hypothetical protein [Chlorogloeopsis fritschii C42_A2020_084]